MKNPFIELRESKARWITLLVYLLICIIVGFAGGWKSLSIVLLLPGVAMLFGLWAYIPSMGTILTATFALSIGGGVFIQTDISKFYKAKTSIVMCDKYLERSVCLYRAEAQRMMDEYCESNDPFVLYEFLKSCPNSKRYPQVDAKYKECCASLYAIAQKKNTVVGWETYQNQVPKSAWADSQNQINTIKQQEERAWDKESTAWQRAKTLNTSEGYEKYLNLYPNGAHSKNAIDALVNDIMKGEYGELPNMEQTGYSQGTSTKIAVNNNTQYTLTLLYSSTNDSKRLVLAPHQKKSISLRNGKYKITASVNASRVSSYAGTENLNGGSYEVTYYISTSYHRY